jgi:serine/threonine protein kinase
MASLVGQRIGSYRLVSQLGSGAMGAVYVGEHTMIGRRAAIKVLHEHSARIPAIVTRFFDEARAVNRIAHPGIVDIYDCGEDPQAGAYLVMELLEGESLGARLRRKAPMPLAMIQVIVREVAAALDEVHRAGIVHRDLKPDNIFLLSDGTKQLSDDIALAKSASMIQVTKLLDFGVARLADAKPIDAQSDGRRGRKRLTRPFQVLGTPLYMAPEQAMGALHIDHRADTYALGVIVFELVTGSPPFSRASPTRLLLAHQYKDVPPVAADPELEQVLHRALAKIPAERQQSAGEFADEFCQVSEKMMMRVTGETVLPGELPHGGQTGPAISITTGPDFGPTTLNTESEPESPLAISAVRLCPVCEQTAMVPTVFGDVEIDRCTGCSGIWLDGGELDRMF